MAAEYILSSGNPNVILCERGIRTFETATRNTLDLSAVPVVRERTHLPIMVDPSHGTGHRPLVRPLAVAGAAVGADGIIIEVHPDPPMARSDSEQSLSFPEFGDLMDDLRRHEYLRNPTARSAMCPPSHPPSAAACAPASTTWMPASQRCSRSARSSRWPCSRRAPRTTTVMTSGASAS